MEFNLIVVFFVGILAGFINVNAGGGSLFTMPLLIFLGLSPVVANGTNRIAILAGALSGIWTFKKNNIFPWKLGLLLSIPAVMGSVLGANIAVVISDNLFKSILAVVMMLVLFVIVLKPQTRAQDVSDAFSKKKKIIATFVFFFIGLYGGFIQVGVGFLIMGALAFITGLPLVTVNVLKIFVVAVYTIFSLAVFAVHGKLDVALGITLAMGSVLGNYFGVKLAIAKGDKFIRIVVAVAVSAMAIKVSGILHS